MVGAVLSAAALTFIAHVPLLRVGSPPSLPMQPACCCSIDSADESTTDQAEALTKDEQALMALTDEELIALADDAETIEYTEPAPQPYVGPMPEPGEKLRGVLCSIELTEVGLVLEVAESLASGGDGRAGLGLFVRLAAGVESVTLTAGVAVCGYAHGRMVALPDQPGGKTVGFWLRTPLTSFFFERELHTVSSLLAPGTDVDTIAGHTIVRDDATGEVSAIEADASWAGARYFVPDSEQGMLDIMNIGQFSNDLAMPGTAMGAANGYGADSAERNLVRLSVALQTTRLLRPSTTRNRLMQCCRAICCRPVRCA